MYTASFSCTQRLFLRFVYSNSVLIPDYSTSVRGWVHGVRNLPWDSSEHGEIARGCRMGLLCTVRLPKVVEWGRMCRDHSRIYLPSNMQARRVNGLGWTEPSAPTALSAPLHEPSSVNRVACTVPQGMPSQGTLPGLPMRPMSLPPPGMPPHSSQHPRPPLSMLRHLGPESLITSVSDIKVPTY